MKNIEEKFREIDEQFDKVSKLNKDTLKTREVSQLATFEWNDKSVKCKVVNKIDK